MFGKQKTKFWQGKNVVVLGAGKSGLACAQFLKQQGNRVMLSDAGFLTENTKQMLENKDISYEEGGHTESILSQSDYMVASPGIPLTALPFQIARHFQIPVISEIELASQLTSSRIIGITGSNGKTTTVTLIDQLLRQAGFKVGCGGNIGTPLISLIDQDLDYMVVEISSFQLETTFTLAPYIGVLLNLYPNHLDRHQTLDNYFQIKSRLFQHQGSNDWCVLNAEFPIFETHFREHVAKQIWFSAHPNAQKHAIIQNDHLVRNIAGESEPMIPVADLPLKGRHNLENYLAATAVSGILDIPAKTVAKAFQSVGAITHRQEFIRTFQGRTFINDSKATNYLATLKAIDSFQSPLILIAGGRDKGGDMAELLNKIKQRVKHVVLLGEAGPLFERRLTEVGYLAISRALSMQEAVEQAFKHSNSGDMILLSPACASYDMYANFEVRGDTFRQHVKTLNI